MDIVTAQERGQRQTDDEAILVTATSEDRLLLTNDTDFLRIHSEWLAAGKRHAGIVYWPQQRPVGIAIAQIHQYALLTSPDDAIGVVKFV